MRFELKDHKDRARWLAARSGGIGASEAAAVLGESPWLSRLELYCQKIGLSDGQVESEAMEWGLRLEDAIADKFREATGFIVDRVGHRMNLPCTCGVGKPCGKYSVFTSTALPFAFCTLDRIVREDVEGDDLVLEIKTARADALSKWEESGVPRNYWIQVQHQLLVTGFSRAFVAVLFGGQAFRWAEVKRDEAFILTLAEEERRFWDCVQKQEQPEPDGSESAKSALNLLYPTGAITESAIPFPPEAGDWDEVIATQVIIIKEAETKKREAENKLKAFLSEQKATLGMLPSGISYSWSESKRSAYEVAASTVFTLRRKAPKGGK